MKVPAMIEKIQQNKISIEQIKKRITTVKQDIGINSDNDMTLGTIIDEIENLKNNDIPKKEESRDYNKDIPIDEYEQKEKIRSLNNNARQFQNEFTLIENYEKNNNKYLVEIHKKFTLAVACILFTLVGAPLGILVRKGGITIASALSIAFFLIYYILLIWGEQLADRALLDPAIGSWMPNIVLFIVGLIILFLSDKKN
jgi:lipopolysaccharide export system permease protein